MAGIGQLSAVAGLNKSVDYAAKNQREFAQMKNIETDIAKSEQENLMAQEMESKQYAEIEASAAKMLGPDRERIQKKSLELQANIRSKIEEYGSRKAFFSNGGVALLSKYKSEVLNSPETLSYMDNKSNMETLMKIMQEGKGHLISDTDRESLENYNAGRGTAISYSGLKAEVKIPENYYDYQEEVPAEVILKSNYLQIYNNWLLDNPGLKGLKPTELQEQLLSYTMTHHYGQGTNKERLQANIAEKNLRSQQRAVRDAGVSKEDKVDDGYVKTSQNYIAEYNNAITASQSSLPMTLENIMSNDNYTIKLASKVPAIGRLTGKLNTYDDYTSNYTTADNLGDRIAKGFSRATGFDNKYKVAGATVLQTLKTKDILDWLSPGATNRSDLSLALNQSEYHSPNGEKLKKDFVDEQQGKKFTYETMISGYIDGGGKMITTMLDSNGKPLKPEDLKDHKKIFNGKISQEMFAVLKNEDGEKVFRRVGVNSPIGESIMGELLGTSNDIRDETNARTDKYNKVQAEKAFTKQEAKIIKMNVAASSQQGGIFATTEFQSDALMTKRSDGFNRNELVKAYYLAASASVKRGPGEQQGIITPETLVNDGFFRRSSDDNFANKIKYSKEIEDAVKDPKINDDKFIDLITEIISEDKSEDIMDNKAFAAEWKKYIELLKKQ
jgi:hypothetical protein